MGANETILRSTSVRLLSLRLQRCRGAFAVAAFTPSEFSRAGPSSPGCDSQVSAVTPMLRRFVRGFSAKQLDAASRCHPRHAASFLLSRAAADDAVAAAAAELPSAVALVPSVTDRHSALPVGFSLSLSHDSHEADGGFGTAVSWTTRRTTAYGIDVVSTKRLAGALRRWPLFERRWLTLHESSDGCFDSLTIPPVVGAAIRWSLREALVKACDTPVPHAFALSDVSVLSVSADDLDVGAVTSGDPLATSGCCRVSLGLAIRGDSARKLGEVCKATALSLAWSADAFVLDHGAWVVTVCGPSS